MKEMKRLINIVYLFPLWFVFGEILAAWQSGFDIRMEYVLVVCILFSVVYSAAYLYSHLWKKGVFVVNGLAALFFLFLTFSSNMREQLGQTAAAVNGLLKSSYGFPEWTSVKLRPGMDCSKAVLWLMFPFFWLTLYLFWKEVSAVWQLIPSVFLFLVPVVSNGVIPHFVTVGFFCALLLAVISADRRGTQGLPGFCVGIAALLLSFILIAICFPEDLYKSLRENVALPEVKLGIDVVQDVSIRQGEFEPDGKLEYHNVTMYTLTIPGRAGRSPYIYLKSFEGTSYENSIWTGKRSKWDLNGYTPSSDAIGQHWKIIRKSGKEDVIPYGDIEWYALADGAVVCGGGEWESYSPYVYCMENEWMKLLEKPLKNTEQLEAEQLEEEKLEEEREIPKKIEKICREKMQNIKAETYTQLASGIRELFDNNYHYTMEPGKVPSGEDELLYFLRKSKKGYCLHFASAAVYLFRSAGVPARYVQGYRIEASEVSPYNAYEIKDSMAHAWVEINIDGTWIPVDVTPGAADSNSDGTGTSADVRKTAAPSGTAITADKEKTNTSTNPPGDSGAKATEKPDKQEKTERGRTVLLLFLRIVIGVAAAAVVLFGVVRWLQIVRRKFRVHRFYKHQMWRSLLIEQHRELLHFLEKRNISWNEYSRRETAANICAAILVENDRYIFEEETKWYVDKMFAIRYHEDNVSYEEFLKAKRWYGMVSSGK